MVSMSLHRASQQTPGSNLLPLRFEPELDVLLNNFNDKMLSVAEIEPEITNVTYTFFPSQQ